MSASVALNRAGVRNVGVYGILGVTLWLTLFESGIHATLAGVALGLLTPASPAGETEAPAARLERILHPWVGYGIVPLFALANAGVAISGDIAGEAVSSPVAQGVFLGLVFGKPLGIVLATWLAVKLRLCEMPHDAGWRHILGAGCLGGIGFTVSLLIAALAFDDLALVDAAKLGILAASVTAGILGYTLLRIGGRGASGVTER